MTKYMSVTILLLGSACTPSVGSAGMDFDPQGRLVVARVWTSEILVLDPRSGEVLETLAEGVKNPDDLAIDATGRIYFTAIFAGEVRSIRSGEAASVVARVRGANAITFDDRKRLWVAECFTGEDLYEVSPDGAAPARLAWERVGRDCALNGMVPGPDGRLYGAQPTLGRLVAIDPETGATEVLASGLGGQTYAVAFLPSGALIALRKGEIVVIDRETRGVARWAALPIDGDNLLVAPDGEVFVSSPSTGEIVALREDGTGRTVLEGTDGRTLGGAP